MKKLSVIVVLLALALTACGPASKPPTDGASAVASDSVPGVLLEAPNRARDAANEANERAKELQESLPKTAE